MNMINQKEFISQYQACEIDPLADLQKRIIGYAGHIDDSIIEVIKKEHEEYMKNKYPLLWPTI